MKSRVAVICCLATMGLGPWAVMYGANQVVTPDTPTHITDKVSPILLTVGYSTAEPCADGTTGLGLLIHWDSSKLSLQEVTNVLQTGLIAQGTAESDTLDADADPSTDRLLRIAWADIDGGWPGNGCAGADLFTVNLAASDALTDTTAVNLSAVSNAAGFGLSVQSSQVRADLDRGGTTDAHDDDDDADGLPDAYEAGNQGLDPRDGRDAALDPDDDRYTTLAEYEEGTDPHNSRDNPRVRRLRVYIRAIEGATANDE